DDRADELVHPQGAVFVVERLGPQDRAPPGLGLVATHDLLEGHDPAVLVARRAPDGQVPTVRGEDRAGLEAGGAVRGEGDEHVAPYPVRLGDPPDLEEGRRLRQVQSSNSMSTWTSSR